MAKHNTTRRTRANIRADSTLRFHGIFLHVAFRPPDLWTRDRHRCICSLSYYQLGYDQTGQGAVVSWYRRRRSVKVLVQNEDEACVSELTAERLRLELLILRADNFEQVLLLPQGTLFHFPPLLPMDNDKLLLDISAHCLACPIRA